MIRRAACVLLFAGLLGASASCDVDNLLNRTASFGGGTAGQRSTFAYMVINNTPYRAIFTAGAYDDLDRNTEPQIQQFGNDPYGTTLEGESTSSLVQPNCARVFAIGTGELLSVVERNLPEDGVDPDALVNGVYFSSGELGSAEGAQPDRGGAPPFEARLGVDFACNSLLIIRLEIDDVGPDPFRIDLEVIRAEDDRNPPS